jgi:tRNA1(Val) A37 N6-methylase TrmN6
MTLESIKRLERRYIKPVLGNLKPWRQVTYSGIRIYYKKILDGGGPTIGQDLVQMLRERGLPNQRRVFEWCAGPGFIGLSMLARGMCQTLCLADVNKRAVEACRLTVRENGLHDRVSVYHSNNLRDIPASERWDLVVGNPPHFADACVGDVRAHDRDWHIHREFYATVGKFLNPGGVIVLVEHNQGSTVETFREMIEQSGLQVVFVDGCAPGLTPDSRNYHLGIMRHADPPPAWAI